jgi:NADH-quinone oxidoreductase subunit N
MLLGTASIVLLFISYPYFRQHTRVNEEYYLLFQTSVFGAAILVCSVHFATLFLGLEILSISLYSLIAYTRNWKHSLEGGLKYLILAAASSAFLLFGMALIYTETGELSFSGLQGTVGSTGVLFTAGVAMMLVAVGFKLALVPFHTWTPDIYQGAPTPVSALIASVSKGSMVVVLIRFINATQSQQLDWFVWMLSLMAIASMLAGSILALQQRNLKRLLAYSSIAHLGYILIAIIAATDLSTQAVTFYLVAYFIAVIGAFGTLSVFNTDQELEEINDLRGMFWTRPLVSIVFSVLFFSMVGIPLTAGFMGKFYVVLAAVDHGMWLLALVLIISSIIGLYYYLRVIKTMLSPVEQATTKTANGNISKMGFGVVTILGILVILFGVVPSQLIAVIRSIEPGF